MITATKTKKETDMSCIHFNEQGLREFDFRPVRERVMAEHGWDDSTYDRYEGELRRFFCLIGTCDGPLAVISRKVDEIWHQLVLFTPLYREFCQKVFGRFIDHVPRTAYTPIPVAAINNFVNEYMARYGALNPLWLEDVPARWKGSVEKASVGEGLDFQWSGWPGR
jgi:hypothetical protein